MDSIIQSITSSLGISRDSALLLIGFAAGVILTAIAKRNRADVGIANSSDTARANKSGNASLIAADIAKQLLSSSPVHTNISVHNHDVQLDPECLSKINEQLSSGNKIGAIKIFREATGFDLTLSKAIVESIEMTQKKGSQIS